MVPKHGATCSEGSFTARFFIPLRAQGWGRQQDCKAKKGLCSDKNEELPVQTLGAPRFRVGSFPLRRQLFTKAHDSVWDRLTCHREPGK